MTSTPGLVLASPPSQWRPRPPAWRIPPPPPVPARDPAKIAGGKLPSAPAPVLSNPFTASTPGSDPFGMSSFAAANGPKDPFAAGVFGQGNFSLDQLDPLANRK